jgi:hypothetical protein
MGQRFSVDLATLAALLVWQDIVPLNSKVSLT